MPDIPLNNKSLVTTSATTAPAAGTSETWSVTALATGIRTLVAGETYALVDATSGASSSQQAEIVRITAATAGGTSITVTRGCDNTTPVAHAGTSTFNFIVVAGALPITRMPAYSATASSYTLKNDYDILRGVYNYKSANTRIMEQGISRAMAGGLSSHIVIGDSVSAGAIAQNGAAWAFDRARAWPMAMRDQLSMLGVPTAGTGIIRHVDGAVGIDPRWVSAGTWVGDVGYAHTVTLNSTATLTPDRDGTVYDHLYFDSGLGTFTISVDGVLQKTVATTGAAGWKIARVTGLNIKAGVTQIQVKLTVVNGGGFYSAGGSVWTPSGGLLVHNPSQSASTASGTGIAAWSDYTAGTGLGTIYDNVAGRKRTVTDAASTSGSSTLTSATGAFTVDDVGKPITQTPGSSGPMFIGECYIGAFLTSTTVTIYSGLTNAAILSANTTSAQTVQIGRDPDCVHIALGANDIAALGASDAAIIAAITTIRGHFTSSDCILHLPHEMSTTLISAARAAAYQASMYKLADTLDVPLYDWRDRIGSFAAGQANGSYGDNLAHLTPATEADLGSQLGWIIGGGGGKPQTYQVPTVDADLTNKKYVDGKTTGTKVSALAAVTVPAGTDEIPVNQSGTSKKMTLTQVNAYTEPVSAASTSTQTGFAADTYIAGSGLTITPARLQAGAFYRCRFDVAKTAAGVATAAFALRLGTAGSTADTARCTFTFPTAGTAAIDNGFIDIIANFRAVGSGTTAVVQGVLVLMRTNTTTGFVSTGGLQFMSPIRVTSSGFDSTTVTKIGLSLNAGTSASWTLTAVQADMLNLT